jgi:NitT/TauT family transport system substrate-binding protein
MLGAFLLVMVVIGAGTLVYKVQADSNTIYWVTVSPQLQQDQIGKHLINAGVAWEPFPSQSNQAGVTNTVLWSEDIWPNHPCCVLAVRSDFAAQQHDLVVRVIRATIDATNWMLNTISQPESGNFTALTNLAASITMATPASVAESYNHITYTTVVSQADENMMANFTDMLISLNQMTAETLHQRGFANSTALIQAMVDTSYYQEAMQLQPSNLTMGTVNLGNIQADMHGLALLLAARTDIVGSSLYERYGVKAVFPNPAGFSTGGAVMDAFATQLLDMADLGCAPAILKMVNAGTNVKIVAMANEDGSGIYAEKGVTTFQDLCGKCVGNPGPSSIQYLMLLYQAQQEGIQVKLRGT